jgi:hypothetical protein
LILLPHVNRASVHVSTDHLHGSVGSGGCRTGRPTRYAHNLIEVHVRQIIVCGKPARSSTSVLRLGACSTPRPGQGSAPSPGGTAHHVTCSSYRCRCRVRWSTATASPLPSAPGPPRKCADPIRQVPRPSANGAAVGRVGVAGFTFGDEHRVLLRSQKTPKDLLQDSCP